MPPFDRSPSPSQADDPLPELTGLWTERAAPGSGARTPAPLQDRTIPVAGAQFILDHNDLIRSYKLETSGHWYIDAIDLRGKSLRKLLCQLRPDWEPHLPENLCGDDAPVHLPEAVKGTHGVVLTLRRLCDGERTYITAVPELAPPDVFNEAGITDFQPDTATFAKLYLRLRQVESRLDHYLSHHPGVVFHQRADLSFSYVGPGSEALLGAAPGTLTRDSQALLRLIHPGDERSYYQELDRNAQSERPFSLVYRVINPQTNRSLYLLDLRSPVRSSTGLVLGYEGVWLDITRQKIAEYHLTTRAWKENISTLTGGLLNDFGNAMTGIFALSELYHNTLPEEHPLRDGLGLIRQNAAQAQQMVQKIIELNRESTGDRTYVNLGRVIRDSLDVVRLVLPRGTHVTGPAVQGDWPVYLDEPAFRQMLVNLAMNSRDALQGPGEIRVMLRRLAAGDLPLVDTVPPLTAGREPAIELVFADNGCGISAAHLSRVFDPFFSTKDSARGAGLGLYNAKLFAESHGGQMAVRSSAGRGTEIVMVLPVADLTPNPSESPRDNNPIARRIRAVVLDPDSTEDTPIAEALRRHGWHIYCVSTPEHVHRVLREEGVLLDLLILRHQLPEAQLRMLVAEMRRDHPGLPIALSLSGNKYSTSPAALRTQVDLVLPAGIADRDAVESLASLLRLP